MTISNFRKNTIKSELEKKEKEIAELKSRTVPAVNCALRSDDLRSTVQNVRLNCKNCGKELISIPVYMGNCGCCLRDIWKYRHREKCDCNNPSPEISSYKINRLWAMPNKETFKIKPIKELLNKYVNSNYWIDPFSGNNSPAKVRNDLNPKSDSQTHLSAEIFAERYNGKIDGLILDPPYSPRQIKECYESIGLKIDGKITNQIVLNKVKKVFSEKMKIGSFCISFGWNSNGMGINRGFEPVEILLISHGGNHNDTICLVEKKVRE